MNEDATEAALWAFALGCLVTGAMVGGLVMGLVSR